MPADALSALLLILLHAGAAVERLWPYVLAGVVVAACTLRWSGRLGWRDALVVPSWAGPVAAALAGVLSPVPTLAATPVALQLWAGDRSRRNVLAFVLASSLLNPQMFVLTAGAVGLGFAMVQLATVLIVSSSLAHLFGRTSCGWQKNSRSDAIGAPGSLWSDLTRIGGHVSLYFLVGVLAGAALQVLLPATGALGWLARSGWLSTPAVGWLAAPFYTCGGSAVPLASSLLGTGFSPGAVFTFLMLGPALRGSTLASLGCVLPRRRLVLCLGGLVIASTMFGYVFDYAARVM